MKTCPGFSQSLQASAACSCLGFANTKPEMKVRRITHGLGYRYRLHDRRLPGNPDLSFQGRRKVILVHGCFWHQHNCRLGRKIPASNTEYWHPKLAGNVARDEYVRAELARLGWDVLVIWECETGDVPTLAQRITSHLEGAFAGALEPYPVAAGQRGRS